MANSLINGGGGDHAPSKSAQTADRRVWMYRGTEARLFNSPEEVPEGWTDTPTEDAPAVEPEAPSDTPKRRGRPPKAKDDEGEPDEL